MWLSNYCVRWDRKLPRVTETLRLFKRRTSPHVLPPRCQRRTEAALGSPLGGCVGVQHSGALHPCPNRVHPGHHGLFFHTTPTPLDAVVDSKHQSAPLRCRYLSLSSLTLSLSPRLPPFLSLAPLLLRLFDRAVRGAKWRGLFHLAFSCRACFSK